MKIESILIGLLYFSINLSAQANPNAKQTAKNGAAIEAVVLEAAKGETSKELEHPFEDFQWWKDAKFGMSKHWGLYSIIGKGEWIMFNKNRDVREDRKPKVQFTAEKFNAKDLAQCNKDAGMKYMVMTSRHHDGFSLWDSSSSYDNFTSSNSTSKKDFVAESTTVFHEAGLKASVNSLDLPHKRAKDKSNVTKNTNTLAVCSFTLTPDLPLLTSSVLIENEIIAAVKKFSDRYLGTAAPTSAQLSTAITQYNTFIANVSEIDLGTMDFLRVFARELKYNSTNTTIIGYANNAVNIASQAVCDGNVVGTTPDLVRGYSYRFFGRAAVLLGVMDGTNIVPAGNNSILTAATKTKFAYTLWLSTRKYEHYWVSDYANYQLNGDAIDTDIIYNHSDTMMAYCMFQNTMNERYRYMMGFQRFMNRFLSPSSGTANGIKQDGSGFHHVTAYNSYMYAYQSVTDNLLCLDGTRFQIGVENYKTFRNAVLVQRLQANDATLQALSTCGRKPKERIAQMPNTDVSSLAIVGGKILGLSTADPVLAGFYNRVNGVANAAFNYNTRAPFEEGFIQLNYSNMGVYRKIGSTKNWVAVNKGFTRALWGTETYIDANRFGRCQGYGSLEILYPGNTTANGYNATTWDWNHSPGATVIKLPWGKLHAEKSKVHELQTKAFAGSLTFKQKKLDYLSKTYGEFGMFGMDFQQKTGQGEDIVYGPDTHNSTFVFKKSNFFFDDIIVSLASGISNNDVTSPTVTTLYQRMNNNGVTQVNVNGTAYGTDGTQTFSGGANNWLLDNYGTGFYVMADNNNSLKVIKGNQQVPQNEVVWSGSLPTTNPIGNYYTGYIDHGTNPSNRGYEYIIKPNAIATDMQNLHTIITSGNKPYTVHQKNSIAHILEHKDKEIFGYCAFTSITNISFGNVKSINNACMVMTDNSINGKIQLSISNPDLGLNPESYAPSVRKIIDVVLDGQWTIDSAVPGVALISSNVTETLLRFTTIDGNAYELNLTNATNLGVNSNNLLEESLQIYPNPNKGQFTLNYNGKETLENLELYSVNGQLVKVVPIKNFSNQKEIIVPNLPAGLYLLKIKTENATATKKIIIE